MFVKKLTQNTPTIYTSFITRLQDKIQYIGSSHTWKLQIKFALTQIKSISGYVEWT